MYRHVLIPTDGSELARQAVMHGLSLAKLCGAKVTALTVQAPFYAYDVLPSSKMDNMSGAFVAHAEYLKMQSTNILGGVADAAKDCGVSCELVQIEQDQPHEAIIAVAANRGCDLIVMASHGRSGLAAVLLGSVTTKVLTHTKLPVLVCH